MVHSLKIDGVDLEFPYEPYPCQQEYIKKLIKALSSGWNGLLESPTGTGKTLCLLCGCLGWVRHLKKMGKTPGVECGPIPKIIYSSRTHSQLSQVVRELNKTSYALDMAICLLGSRDNMCLNDQVKDEPNKIIKNNMCRIKVSSRTCSYYNNLEGMEKKKSVIKPIMPTKAMDIEDLVKFSAQHKICPYFKSRGDMETADLILLPYNYMLESRTRRANKIDLRGNVVIFDEAHNLESICESSVSVSLSSKDLALTIREVKSTLTQLQEEQESIREQMDDSTAAFGTVDIDNKTDKIDLNDVAHVAIMIQKLEEKMDEINLDANDELGKTIGNLPGKVYPGDFMTSLLNKCGIIEGMRDSMSQLLDRMANFLTAKSTGLGSLALNRGLHLQSFGSFISTVFHQDTISLPNSNIKPHSLSLNKPQQQQQPNKAFLSYITHEETKSQPSSAKKGICVNYWCFSAGFGMEDLMKKGVHSVIITSGTLSPLQQFATDMQIPLPLTLENKHVIEDKQVFCSILKRGPDNVVLDSSYRNRNNEAYMNSLANTVINVCRSTPEGMLVFFASYAQMNAHYEFWKDHKLLDRIDALKTVFIEPRDKSKFSTVLNEFSQAVETAKGAVFLAVCRGKLSEGMDLSDRQGRCVLIVGIPFPPLMDPRVCLKKYYLDSNKNTAVSGQSWYRLEAVRAVNQAMGRVIRHKNDYGAIILADSRFNSWPVEDYPSWLRPVLTRFEYFGQMQMSLTKFFNGRGGGKTNEGRSYIRVNSSSQSAFDVASHTVLKRKIDVECNSQTQSKPNVKLFHHFDDSILSQACYKKSLQCFDHNSTCSKRNKVTGSVFDAMRDIPSPEPSFISENTESCGNIPQNLPSTSSKPPQATPKKANRIKLKPNWSSHTNSSIISNSHKMEPAEFSKQIKSLFSSEDLRSFTKALANYKSGVVDFDDMVKIIKANFLPSREDLVKGFSNFVKAEHRKAYFEICKSLNL